MSGVVHVQQAPVEFDRIRLTDGRSGFRADTGGRAIDFLAARNRRFEDLASTQHPVKCRCADSQFFPLPRYGDDLPERKLEAVDFNDFLAGVHDHVDAFHLLVNPDREVKQLLPSPLMNIAKLANESIVATLAQQAEIGAISLSEMANVTVYCAADCR